MEIGRQYGWLGIWLKCDTCKNIWNEPGQEESGLRLCETYLDDLRDYGLMSYSDRRSYFHSADIMLFRNSLPTFDFNEY